MPTHGTAEIKKALDRLAELAPPLARRFAPALTHSRLAVEITTEGVIWAAHLTPDTEDPELSVLQTLRLRPGEQSGLLWRPVVKKIADAGFPWLLVRGADLYLGFNGRRDLSETARRAFTESFFVTEIEAGEVGSVRKALPRVREAVMAAQAHDGRLHLLCRKWSPPIANPAAVRLLYHRLGTSGELELSVELPGTEVPGTYPADYAICVDAAGRGHVAFDALVVDPEAEPGAAPERVTTYLALDRDGACTRPRVLGPAPELPLLSRFVFSPGGQLYLLQVHLEDGAPVHRLVDLKFGDTRGGPQRCLWADHLLRLHVLEFDDADEAKYRVVADS